MILQHSIKSTVIFLVIAFVLIIGITLIAPEATVSEQQGMRQPANGQQVPTTYTLAEVATHATAQNCWTVVRGNVYDVTSWISKHPGGQGEILGMCGKDASAAFEGQHGGQARPEQELASFKIGTIKN